MSMETMEPQKEHREFTLAETNAIQIHLAQESGRDVLGWVDENSGKVREIIKANPELADDYLLDPEGTEKKIAELLEGWEEETVH